MSVCLFDIDGTLLSSGGAGQAAMEAALEQVFGVTAPTDGIPVAGRTDRAITTDLMNFHGIEVTDRNRDRFIEAYLECLPRELAARTGLILPGVSELLELLSQRTDLMLGLLTGNVRRGADIKLQYYRLAQHFHCGGFGDDHYHRDDVARAAVAQARQKLGRDARRTWVIGDTPADVQCGRAVGATVIAVATGYYSMDELAGTSPDFLFENFSNVASVLRAFD